MLSLILTTGYSQERNNFNIREFKGVWQQNINSERYKTEKIFFVIGDNFMIELYNDFKYDSVYSVLGPERIGFVKKDDEESIENEIFKKKGNLAEDYLMLGNNFECSLPEYDGGEITQMVLYNMNEFYYSKLTIVPQEIQKVLFNEYKKSNKDYLFEFMGIDVREITVPKSFIYTSNKDKTSSYLVKGDIVEVEAIGEEFVKITYHKDDGKVIVGYVKYPDISEKPPIPSFDPQKASTPIEKAICSDVVLASLDRQLAKAYNVARAKYGLDVKKTQIAWVKHRDMEGKNKSKKELIVWLTKMYKERLDSLKNKMVQD